MKNYYLKTPHHVFAGEGSIDNIKEIILKNNYQHVTLLTDKQIYTVGLTEKAENVLKELNVTYECVNNLPSEPKINEVKDVIACMKETDLLIAIGGGSVIDITKIISVVLRAKCDIEALMDGRLTIEKAVPTLMIPTTAGTGAEATPNAIITIPEKELKVGIVHEAFIPQYVILDAALLLKLPKKITAATGIDALAHAIECYISKKANPFSDVFALKSMKLIFENLKKTYEKGSDFESRQNMLLASFYAGICITSSGTTAVHALSYPLGGKYSIPHGVSNAILLADVMAFNRESVEEKLAILSDELGLSQKEQTIGEKSKNVIKALYQLVDDVKIPRKLCEFGVTEKDIDFLVESALGVKRLLDNNPREVTKEDAHRIYRKLI